MPEFFANWVNSVLKFLVVKLSIQTNVSHDEESKWKNVKSVSRTNAYVSEEVELSVQKTAKLTTVKKM
jgi:predicted transport protein